MVSPDILSTLQSSKFLKHISPDHLDTIAGFCSVDTYAAGDYVFRQGDFGEHLYIIVDGQIHLERSVDFGQRKGSVVIESLGKGRVLGCWSTLLGAPHVLMSSANCQRPTTVLAVRGAQLRQLMTSKTDFGFNILEI